MLSTFISAITLVQSRKSACGFRQIWKTEDYIIELSTKVSNSQHSCPMLFNLILNSIYATLVSVSIVNMLQVFLLLMMQNTFSEVISREAEGSGIRTKDSLGLRLWECMESRHQSTTYNTHCP